MKKLILLIITLTISFGCHQNYSKKEIRVTDNFLREVVSILEKKSINSQSINWDSLKTNLNTKYPRFDNDSIKPYAINWIYKNYDFKHHGFMSKEKAFDWRNNSKNKKQKTNTTLVTGKFIKPNIGYIEVPTFSSGDSIHLKMFAKHAQKELKRLKEEGAKKWIIDLSKNRGGNMWPMLSGMGPLIGDGKVGYFTTKSKDIVGIWKIKNGSSQLIEGDTTSYSVLIPKTRLNISNDKTAILISDKTASSGEALLMAFIGKKNIKTFGTKSANYTTSNTDFELSDGSILWVTTAYFADRNLKIYPQGITPMEKVEIDSLLIDRAALWLNGN